MFKPPNSNILKNFLSAGYLQLRHLDIGHIFTKKNYLLLFILLSFQVSKCTLKIKPEPLPQFDPQHQSLDSFKVSPCILLEAYLLSPAPRPNFQIISFVRLVFDILSKHGHIAYHLTKVAAVVPASKTTLGVPFLYKTNKKFNSLFTIRHESYF